MEPISYANGSHLNDPAITYGIVFSNFMSKGVFTFQGGTDTLIKKMVSELKANGCEVRKCALVEGIDIENGQVVGVRARSQNTGASIFLRGKFAAEPCSQMPMFAIPSST